MRPIPLKRRHDRQNFSAFGSLIAAPVITTLRLPASGRFMVVSRAGAAAGTLAVSLTSTTNSSIKVNALNAGAGQVIDFLPKDGVVNVSAGFDLKVDGGNGRYFKICGGV